LFKQVKKELQLLREQVEARFLEMKEENEKLWREIQHLKQIHSTGSNQLNTDQSMAVNADIQLEVQELNPIER
jgi:uncharacterized membrane-anchored protein YhcB (DUF1043 family)